MMPNKKSFALLLVFATLLGSCATADAQLQARGCEPAKETLPELQRSIACVEARLREQTSGLSSRLTSVSGKLDVVSATLDTLIDETEALSQVFVYGSVRQDAFVILMKPALQLRKPTRWQPVKQELLDSISVIHERPGVYSITFIPSQKSTPIVIITPFAGFQTTQSGFGYGWISRLDENGFQVQTSRDGKTLNDLSFSFLVLSPDL